MIAALQLFNFRHLQKKVHMAGILHATPTIGFLLRFMQVLNQVRRGRSFQRKLMNSSSSREMLDAGCWILDSVASRRLRSARHLLAIFTQLI